MNIATISEESTLVFEIGREGVHKRLGERKGGEKCCNIISKIK